MATIGTKNAAIMAVGSELLVGQITNRNAAWLSDKLSELGYRITCHLTVDDDRDQIASFLNVATQHADYVFITGGLGPTSDDLTRDGVAAWASVQLEFHPASWQHIQCLFKRFGRDVPESNRQQCFFPAGAQVLFNPSGTANGFHLCARQKEIWVLPGPPREIEAMWQDHLVHAVATRIAEEDRTITRKWRTIGHGESHLAQIVEPIVENQGVHVAYRAHAPFIETKVSFPRSEAAKHNDLCKNLDLALSPWLFEKDDDSVALRLLKFLEGCNSITIYDGATEGYLEEELAPLLRGLVQGKRPETSLMTTWWDPSEDLTFFLEECLHWSQDVDVVLAVVGFSSQTNRDEWAIGIKTGDASWVETLEAPYRGQTLRTRNRKAVAALSFKHWLRILTTQAPKRPTDGASPS